MSGCSLGVNAFRSSVLAAAQHLARPCSRLLPAASSSSRCFSSWQSPAQPRRVPPIRQHGRTTNAHSLPLAGNARRAVTPQWLGIRTVFGGHGVITRYNDLPPDYRDEEGLPFARRDLLTAEVVALFGPRISTLTANKLLRILHGRRVAGTLDDPTLRVNTMHFSKEHQQIALDYLRKQVPLDEVANAGLRAEDELAALESGGSEIKEETSQIPGPTPRFPLYKRAQNKPNKSVYGPSALDEIRAKNQAKWQAELKRREEEKRKREEEERHGKPGTLQVPGEQQPRQLSPRMREWMAAATSDLKEPPRMKKWERLLPSAVFVLAVAGLCFAYAEFYRAPKRADRLLPDVPPAAATVGALMLANVLGWALWKMPPMWRVLNQYFLIVVATPRAPAMVAAVFSHQRLAHLLENMFFLWLLGVRLHDDVGRGTFLATYFASGTVAALGTLTFSVLANQLHITSLGASGAIYGVGAAYFWLHRFDFFRILGLPPPPNEGFQGLAILAVVAALNIGAIFTPARLKMDLTSHLVGIAVGVLAAHLVEKKRGAGREEKGGQ